MAQTLEILVDTEDSIYLSNFNWFKSKTGYAVCNLPGKKQAYLHRLILNHSSYAIDHINGNKLDNRKSNLRFCNQSQNQANRKISLNNTSGYKGVSWYKAGKKWSAQIGINYKSVFLGYFKTKEEAALAYNNAAIKHFGEFAKLNKIG